MRKVGICPYGYTETLQSHRDHRPLHHTTLRVQEKINRGDSPKVVDSASRISAS